MTLYEIFQSQGRAGVERAAVHMFGAQATQHVLSFTLVGNKNAWAHEIIDQLSEQDKQSLADIALQMACVGTNVEMVEVVLGWGYNTSDCLDTYVSTLLLNDGGHPRALRALLSLATPATDLSTALVYACSLSPYPHQQEMVEGICKFANPLEHKTLALLHALQNNNSACVAGMMPKLQTLPNAKDAVLALPLKPSARETFLTLWAQGEQTAPVWEKRRIEEQLDVPVVAAARKKI